MSIRERMKEQREQRRGVQSIESVREHEENLRRKWKDDKDISHHTHHLSFYFPYRPGSAFSTRDVINLLRSKRLLVGSVNESNINVILVPINYPDGKSFRMDVMIDYGFVDKGIVNIDVAKAVNAIYEEFRDGFGEVRQKPKTQLNDGRWISTEGKILKQSVERKKPEVRE